MLVLLIGCGVCATGTKGLPPVAIADLAMDCVLGDGWGGPSLGCDRITLSLTFADGDTVPLTQDDLDPGWLDDDRDGDGRADFILVDLLPIEGGATLENGASANLDLWITRDSYESGAEVAPSLDCIDAAQHCARMEVATGSLAGTGPALDLGSANDGVVTIVHAGDRSGQSFALTATATLVYVDDSQQEALCDDGYIYRRE